MADRLWMFNPGCPQEECCDDDEESPPGCCVVNWLCSRYEMDDLTMSSPYGTINFNYTPYTDIFGVINHRWWGCLSVSHPKTVSATYDYNTGNVICNQAGQTGSLGMQFNLSCQGSGQFGLSNQFAYRNCHNDGGPDTNYPDISAQCGSDGRIVHTLPFILEMTYRATVVSETETEITYNFPVTDSSTNAIFNPVSGTFVLTKPPLKPGILRKTLYLSDGLGIVPMIYNGPRPVSLGTASDMWWGCATRHVTGGRAKAPSGDCAPTPLDFDTQIIFGLWCKGPSEGFRLYIFHDGCGSYDDGINVQTHQRASLGCSTPWVGQYNQIVGGSINGIKPEDCDPFVFGPISQNFPATPYPYHPLREIYGDSGTWTITE